MKAHRSIAAALCFAVASSACLAESESEPSVAVQSEALTLDEPKPVTQYYALRRDVRRCAFPLCGGYWASLLNGAPTICADGIETSECYVAELTLPAGVDLADGEIVHGQLDLKTYPELELTLGTLRADAVFSPVLGGSASRGSYGLAYDTGIRCIRAPCPSLAVAPLNGEGRGVNTEISFSATDAKRRAALEAAYQQEFGKLSLLGQGAVVVGRSRLLFNPRERTSYRRFVVTDVYAEKPGEYPVCVVSSEDLTATAWNFPSLDAAADLIGGLTGRVEVLMGRCGDLDLPCTLEYAPVHGIIDALGEICVDAGNACQFRAKIIHAAGGDSKAAGWWSSSLCYEPAPTCEADAECVDGFCGWLTSSERTCRPWAIEGEHCEGFVSPQNRRFCAPGLRCQLSEPTGDAGGICVSP